MFLSLSLESEEYKIGHIELYVSIGRYTDSIQLIFTELRTRVMFYKSGHFVSNKTGKHASRKQYQV